MAASRKRNYLPLEKKEVLSAVLISEHVLLTIISCLIKFAYRKLSLHFKTKPQRKGQPPNNGQNACPKSVHYSEVPLYMQIR